MSHNLRFKKYHIPFYKALTWKFHCLVKLQHWGGSAKLKASFIFFKIPEKQHITNEENMTVNVAAPNKDTYPTKIVNDEDIH